MVKDGSADMAPLAHEDTWGLSEDAGSRRSGAGVTRWAESVDNGGGGSGAQRSADASGHEDVVPALAPPEAAENRRRSSWYWPVDIFSKLLKEPSMANEVNTNTSSMATSKQGSTKADFASPPAVTRKKSKEKSFVESMKDDGKGDALLNGGLSLWWVLQDAGELEHLDEDEQEEEMAEAENEQNKALSNQKMPFMVFHPWSRPRIAWDLLVMLCLIENLLLVPFNLAFTETQREKVDWMRAPPSYFPNGTIESLTGGDPPRKFEAQSLENLFWFEFAMDCIFLIDIMLNFMTAYVRINEKGDSELVTSVPSIAVKYMKGWFLIDLVGSVPLEFILTYVVGGDSQNSNVTRLLRIFKMLRLLKLTRVWRLGRFINKLKEAFDFNPAVIRAFKMLVFFCLVAHVLSCLLFWVGTIPNTFFTCVSEETECSAKSCFNLLETCMCNTDGVGTFDTNVSVFAVEDETQKCEPSTWLREKRFMLPGMFPRGDDVSGGSMEVTIEDMPVSVQYQVTLYWVLTTMATVGFGDLKPVTEYEIGICIVSQIVGATTFGFIVGNMATLADLLKGRAGEFKEAMDDVTNLLSAFNVPLSVRRRVTKDFNHQFHRPYSKVKSTVIDVIPRALAVQVAKDVFRDILEASPMFKGLPQSVLDQLYLKLQPRHFAPGEVVIRKDMQSLGVFLILTGHVHISDSTNTSKGTTPGRNGSIGRSSSGNVTGFAGKSQDLAASSLLSEDRRLTDAGATKEDELFKELDEQLANGEVNQDQILVTVLMGAMLGEECLLPTNPPVPFVAKAAEWLDLVYLDRREIINLLTDNREALARVHLAARLRNERFHTLLSATKFLQRLQKRGVLVSSSTVVRIGQRGVPPLRTGEDDGGIKRQGSTGGHAPALAGFEAEARAARVRIDPTEVLSVGGVRICDMDLSEVDRARLAEAVNEFSEEGENNTSRVNWSEWMDGKGLTAGLLQLKSTHGSYERAMAHLDKQQGAASKTKDRHVTLEDLAVLDDEGNDNETGIEMQLMELITRLDRLEERVIEQHDGLFPSSVVPAQADPPSQGPQSGGGGGQDTNHGGAQGPVRGGAEISDTPEAEALNTSLEAESLPQ